MKRMDYKWTALSCTSLGAMLSVLSSSTLIIARAGELSITTSLHDDLSCIERVCNELENKLSSLQTHNFLLICLSQ